MENENLEEVKIRDIRCRHINKKVVVIGKLIFASDVRPQIISARFECQKCGAIIKVIQNESYFKEPEKCICENTKEFSLINKDTLDVQKIVIGQGKKLYDERYESEVESEQLNIFLQGDLCNTQDNILDYIGKEIKLTGTIQEREVKLDNNKISLRLDIYMDAEEWEEVKLKSSN